MKRITFVIITIVFIFFCLNNCGSFNELSQNTVLDSQPDFSVEELTAIQQSECFPGLQHVVKIKEKIKTNEHGWKLTGYKKVRNEIKFTDNLRREYQKLLLQYWKDSGKCETLLNKNTQDFTMSDYDYGYTIQIIPVFEKVDDCGFNYFDIDISFAEGCPCGHNFLEIKSGNKKKYLYWYKEK